MKNTFLEIEKINTLKSHVDKLTEKNINGNKASGSLEVDISYKDISGSECFKSLPFPFELELEGLKAEDILLKNVNVYVVEGRGISVDYTLLIQYNTEDFKEVEIIQLEPETEEADIPERPQPEQENPHILQEEKEENKEATEQEEIEKIKEDISKDYENKLADNLSQREESKISVVTTKKKESELDFLRFFSENVAGYYCIKTIYCGSEEMLNAISKEYKVPLDVLLKGYDRQSGKVTFQYIR